MSLLKIDHLSKSFKLSDTSSVTVLKDINLTFPDAGLVGILGKSGCGKSTLLNLISLLDKPTSGEILINGKSTKHWKRKQVERFRRNEIGIIFQAYNLLEDQDVLYNISLPLLINGYSYKEAEEKAISLLDSISFSKDLYHKKVNKLSGGEKQRVAILRAISFPRCSAVRAPARATCFRRCSAERGRRRARRTSSAASSAAAITAGLIRDAC